MDDDTFKDLWQPKNCICGECMKVQSSIQMKCCGNKPCVTSEGNYLKTFLSLETTILPDQLDWYLKSLDADQERMTAAKKRYVAYKAFIAKEQLSRQQQVQSECPSQQSSSSLPQTSRSQLLIADGDIPRCVLRYIRAQFKDRKGKYTGFNTSNTIAALFAAFNYNTREDEEAFAIMEPEAITDYNSRLSGSEYKVNLDKAVTRMPKMGIVATIVSFECFVNDAIRLVVDAVYYDLNQVSASDYAKFPGTNDDVDKYLASLDVNIDDWGKVCAALKQKLSSDEHMETIIHWNFLQTLLESKKKVLRVVKLPTLYHIVHCFREILVTVVLKREARHSVCKEMEDEGSVKVKELIAHFIDQENYSFKFHVPAPGNSETNRMKVVDIKLKNVETLSHMSRLFYGIRCLYCHGNSDQTLEKGALSESLCSPTVLKQVESRPGQEIEPVQAYLERLQQRTHEEKLGLVADRLLYLNTASFYKYFAKLLAKACVCLVYHCNEKYIKIGETYMNESSKKSLGLDLAEIREAVVAMENLKRTARSD